MNLGNPALAAWYRRVSYTNPHGQTFTAARSRTVSRSRPPPGTRPAQSPSFAISCRRPGKATLGRHGFTGTPILVGGDAKAVPSELQAYASVPLR